MKNIMWVLTFSIVLFLSCGAPFYYERADITKGFSSGIGIGVGTGNTPPPFWAPSVEGASIII